MRVCECECVCVKVGNLQYFLSHERKNGVESSDYHVHRFHRIFLSI